MNLQIADRPAGIQVPRVNCFPPARNNSTNEVVDLAAAYGLKLDGWQQNVLAASLGEHDDGSWAARHIGVSVPRQNGKGALIEARELAGLLMFGEKMIIHSAHETRTAQEGFKRIKAYFENYDDLRRKVANIGNAVAREYIRLRNGQELKFVSRSKSAIRGFSADCLLLDEGQILNDAAWEAILYTVSARPNHQIWMLGTPPLDADDGVVFHRFRARGLENDNDRMAWCEWSAPDGCDLDDPQSWATANPALGQRITLETIFDERRAASDVGFARERLGMWISPETQRIISADSWAAVADPNLVDDGGECAIAIDVSPDRSVATIAAAGWTTDDIPYVDVIESRRGDPDWGIRKFVELCERNDVRAVVIDGMSSANTLIDPLRQFGLTVTVTSARQMSMACGMFFDAVMDGSIRHLDQPALNVALGVARKRMIGDGGWGWSRKESSCDITPVTSATLALWGLLSDDIEAKPRVRSGKACFV